MFTSGATESNNLAILGAARASADRGRHVVTMRTEHKAVLDPCKHLERRGFSVTYLTPTAQRASSRRRRSRGAASRYGAGVDHVRQQRDRGDPGHRRPRALCRERGVAFHSDCAQAAGKVSRSTCGHCRSICCPLRRTSSTGPRASGALMCAAAPARLLQPVIFGGGQERGLRPGTLPMHQIAGFGSACELAARGPAADERARLQGLRERLWEPLGRLGGVHLNGDGAPRVPGILNVSFRGGRGRESGETRSAGLAVSTGAACNSAIARTFLRAARTRARRAARGELAALQCWALHAARPTSTAPRRPWRVRSRACGHSRRPVRPRRTAACEGASGDLSGQAGGVEEGTWVRFRASRGSATL